MGVEFVVDSEKARNIKEGGHGLSEKVGARVARGNETARAPAKGFVAVFKR